MLLAFAPVEISDIHFKHTCMLCIDVNLIQVFLLHFLPYNVDPIRLLKYMFSIFLSCQLTQVPCYPLLSGILISCVSIQIGEAIFGEATYLAFVLWVKGNST